MQIVEGETIATVRVSLTLKVHYYNEQSVFIVKEYVKSKTVRSVLDSLSETGRFFVRHPV